MFKLEPRCVHPLLSTTDCVNLSRLWVFSFGDGGVLWDKCHELEQEVLALPRFCYDSRCCSVPTSKLLGNFEKILVKKRCPYFNVLTLLCFMVVLLPVILCLMYIISSFPKVQTLKVDSEWSYIHRCCIYIRFWSLTKFLLKVLRAWIVWFSFHFEFLFRRLCFLYHHSSY